MYLAENRDISESEQSIAGDEDGDLSDVEEQGYCADTASVEINLKLARVTNPEIKTLLDNTDKVCVNMYYRQKLCNLSTVLLNNNAVLSVASIKNILLSVKDQRGLILVYIKAYV